MRLGIVALVGLASGGCDILLGLNEKNESCGRTPSVDARVLVDECGVFVAKTGDDTNRGTHDHPLRSIPMAITLAAAQHNHRVYVCNGEYDGQVSLSGDEAGTSIF